MSKKKAAYLAAALLTALAGALYKCQDESPLIGNPAPTAPAADAGAP
jgi:hypothetical protein